MVAASFDVNWQSEIRTVLPWEDNCSFSFNFQLDAVSVACFYFGFLNLRFFFFLNSHWSCCSSGWSNRKTVWTIWMFVVYQYHFIPSTETEYSFLVCLQSSIWMVIVTADVFALLLRPCLASLMYGSIVLGDWIFFAGAVFVIAKVCDQMWVW